LRFHITFLSTYFPEQDGPLDVYYQHVLEQMQLAEAVGIDCWWFTEHHFIGYGGVVPNPAVMLALAAGRTSRLRLGSAISILPLHHPIQVAEDYAMVDVASAGRLEFGIGRGNTMFDYTGYGIPQDESRGRFEEATEIITKLWTHDRVSHEGTHWQFPELALFPRPVQQPHPPIWVAGTSVESLHWAGQRGYSIMTVPHVRTPEQVRPGIEAWQEGLRASGYDPATRHLKAHLRVWVDERADRAREVAEAGITRYDTINRMGRGANPAFVTAVDPGYDWAGMRAMGRNIYGNPDEVIRGIETARRNYGIDVLGAQFNFGGIPHADVMKAMRLFGKEVMPAFQPA
jgi:alkanesulfonate monooxygenase SsuD/methylene tetrahydromethanopterin reductase-like flavin-dependent oxidoreductase (luciferase family)